MQKPWWAFLKEGGVPEEMPPKAEWSGKKYQLTSPHPSISKAELPIGQTQQEDADLGAQAGARH